MRNILNQIKWAYQRVVRGYDDRIKWGFDTYLEDIVMKPLREFCTEELVDNQDDTRAIIYPETIRLIDEYAKAKEGLFTTVTRKDVYTMQYKMWKYIVEKIGYYWN
jgi:hypothetical protein